MWPVWPRALAIPIIFLFIAWLVCIQDVFSLKYWPLLKITFFLISSQELLTEWAFCTKNCTISPLQGRPLPPSQSPRLVHLCLFYKSSFMRVLICYIFWIFSYCNVLCCIPLSLGFLNCNMLWLPCMLLLLLSYILFLCNLGSFCYVDLNYNGLSCDYFIPLRSTLLGGARRNIRSSNKCLLSQL